MKNKMNVNKQKKQIYENDSPNDNKKENNLTTKTNSYYDKKERKNSRKETPMQLISRQSIMMKFMISINFTASVKLFSSNER